MGQLHDELIRQTQRLYFFMRAHPEALEAYSVLYGQGDMNTLQQIVDTKQFDYELIEQTLNRLERVRWFAGWTTEGKKSD